MPSIRDFDARLRAAALAYPGAREDFPWGERVVKVGKKVFLFLGVAGKKLSFALKLPATGALALHFPFCEPTGYGLGRAGWVTATFERAADVPFEMLLEWLDESYRAVAPKTLVAQLKTPGSPPARRSSRAPKRTRA